MTKDKVISPNVLLTY
jgi:hypothetical protein